MALTDWSPEEIKALQAQGIDPNYATPAPQEQMSKTGAVLATGKAHAGSYLGGGAGAITGMKYGGMAGVALAGGPEDPLALITGSAGALIGAAIGGGVGAYGGQKAQQAVESPDTYDAQQQAAALAAQQHPYISEATDIGAGALASGGMFSPTTAVKGAQGLIGSLTGRGAGALMAERQAVMGTIGRALTSGDQGTLDAMTARLGEINDALPSAIAKRSAMMNVGLQSAINPALSTGMSLAQGQGMPSGQELAGQALGGAMFAKSWLPHGRPGTQGINEPDEEVNNSNGQEGQETPIAPFESNFTAKNDDGSFKIGNKNLVAPFMNEFAELIPPDAPEDEKAMIRTRNDTLRDTPYDQMREQLHQQVAQEVSLKNPNPTAGSVGDEPVEEEQQTKTPTINEPTQEVTQKEPVKLPAAVEEEPKSPIEEEEKLPGIPTSGKTYNPGVQVGRRGEIQKVTIQNPQVVNPVTGKSSKINSPYVAQDYSPEDLAKYNAVGKKFVDLSNTEPGSPEHIKTWQEYEALRNKYGGMPPKQLQQSPLGSGKVPQIPLGLRQTLLNNKGTVGGLLHSLATTPNHPYQVLAQHLLNRSDTKSLGVKIIHDPTLDSGGDRSHYNPHTDEVRLGTQATGDASVALEEAIHAMTSKKLPNFRKAGAEHLKELQEYLKNGKDKNVKDLINSYLEAAEKMGMHNKLFVDHVTPGGKVISAYGNQADKAQAFLNPIKGNKSPGNIGYAMGNLHEFIAQAFKDPAFQKTLDAIKTTDGRSIWQHIVDAVRRIIGLDVKHGNMLDRVLRTSSELIGQNRPDGLAQSLDRVSSNTRQRTGDFISNAAEMVRSSEEKLGLKPNYNGVFSGSQLLATMFNKLTPTEQQLYKDQGIIAHFQNRKISQEDAVKWLEEHTPKAETHTYGMEGKVSEAKKEYDKMTHEWYEMLPKEQQSLVYDLRSGIDNPGHIRMSKELSDKAYQYKDLYDKVLSEPKDTSSRATSYYNTVSALPTNEPMPEWTATKSGKNVQRVDVVIPLKTEGAKIDKLKGEGYAGKSLEYEANKPYWQPDNLHENLPNTLGWAMIQYKTGPKGEKIAVIAEAQSRWGQAMRERKQELANTPASESNSRALQQSAMGQDHPLLKDYNRLILKAAIEQARKEGATHIMVSDAETAMMTEGHDKILGWDNDRPDTQTWMGVKREPEQAKGMRLNYDTILPKIAEELTGSKGEKVSLGEHKNAYNTSLEERGNNPEVVQGTREIHNRMRAGEIDGAEARRLTEELHTKHGSKATPRSNLIFRNADGTPKTDVSGRLYSINNVPDREPMLYGKQYAKPGESPSGDLLRYKTGEKVEPIQPKFLGGVGRFMTDALLRARQVAPEVSDAYHRYFTGRQKTFGDVYGRVKNVMDKTGFTSQDGQRLVEAMRKEELTKKEVNMGFFKNQAQKQVWNEYKKVYKEQGEEAVKDKEPVFDYKTKQMRIRRLDETSHPLMMKTKVANTIREATDLPEIQKLHDSFIADQAKRGIKPEEAEQNYKLVTGALRGSASKTGDVGGANRFNANRRAQGVPLPDAWTKDDFEDNLYSYASRNASDRSHFKNIESNPSVMAQLGEKQDAWGNPIPPTDKPVVANNKYVSALIRESHGEVGPQGFYTERAGSGLTTALFISSPALSAVHVPISNIAAITTLADNPIQLSKALWAGIKGMTSGIATAQKNGLLVPRARAASRMLDASLTSAERLQTISSIIRRIASFNDLTTKANIGYMQAAMQSIIPSKLTRAENGDINAQQFMRKLDVDYTVGKDYTPDQLSHLATEAVGYLHGTNDPRTMPEWMLRDSEVSGFFSIAHWSVAQTDRFMRDVWMPAKRGNLSPLILGVCGAAVGGEVIKKLREEISGKHSAIPGLSEIINSDRGLEGNAGPLAYNAMAALQFAGFGGLFSQLAKYPFDLAYKNSSQALAFPLDEEVSDIAKTVGQVTSAIMNDPNVNFVDLARLVSSHILTSDFRLTREAYNQMINSGMITGTLAERKQLSDKLGQLRRFEQVEGLPFEEQTESTSNPYMYPEQQEFKKTQDIGQAVKDLPGLMQNIMSQYGEHPDVAMAKLRALKDMQYNTMPSLENYPLSFQKYVGYLQRMEGPQAAQQALEDYMHHKIINEAKSSIVP